MNFSEIKLPSNKTFGLFFGSVFLVLTAYCYSKQFLIFSYISAFSSFLFFLTALIKPDLLRPLNKLWMSLGFFLGLIISPLVLGLLFFGLFSPVAILMRFVGRDELRLRVEEKKTYWINRKEAICAPSFKNQF